MTLSRFFRFNDGQKEKPRLLGGLIYTAATTEPTLTNGHVEEAPAKEALSKAGPMKSGMIPNAPAETE